MRRFLLVRGGLGNRLRAIESVAQQTMSSSDDRLYVLWAVDKDCRVPFCAGFEVVDSRISVIPVKSLFGLFLNGANFVGSLIGGGLICRDFRKVPHLARFMSTAHAQSSDVRRFTLVRYSENIKSCVTSAELLEFCANGLVVHLRGTDNEIAIRTTDFRQIFNTVERECLAGERVIGFSEDALLLAQLKSFGATVPQRDKRIRRDSRSDMKLTLGELYLLSSARKIYAGAYSSFSELAYSLSERAELVTFQIENAQGESKESW